MKKLILGCLLVSTLSVSASPIKDSTCSIDANFESMTDRQTSRMRSILEDKGYEVNENGNASFKLTVTNSHPKFKQVHNPEQQSVKQVQYMYQYNHKEGTFLGYIEEAVIFGHQFKDTIVQKTSKLYDNITSDDIRSKAVMTNLVDSEVVGSTSSSRIKMPIRKMRKMIPSCETE